MRPWASYCPSRLQFPYPKMSDEPHLLYGPFCPIASTNLVFELYPTVDNPGKVLSFVAAVEVLHVTGTSWHLMLGPLRRPMSNSTVSSQPVIQMAKRLCHPPVLSQETLSLERSFHFPRACDSVLYLWHKSSLANWKVR